MNFPGGCIDAVYEPVLFTESVNSLYSKMKSTIKKNFSGDWLSTPGDAKQFIAYKSNILDIHKRKFVKWGGVYNPSSVNPENCIFNYSNYCLSDREKFPLS